MAAKNKKRGNEAEYYIREQLQEKGFEVDRGWGSDGRAMGEHEEVDLRINHTPSPELIQVKRRKAVAAYIIPSENVTAQMLYIDRSPGVKRQVLAVVTLDRYMELLEKEANWEGVSEQASSVVRQMIDLEIQKGRLEGWYAMESDPGFCSQYSGGMQVDEETIEERD